MYLLAAFLTLIFTINVTKAAPTNNENQNKNTNTFYSTLVKKCTFLESENDFEKQEVFNRCSNYTALNDTKTLSRENEQDVLCLLYFDSFVSFCEKISPEKTKIKLIPDVKNGNYRIKEICKNNSLIKNETKHLHDVVTNLKKEEICYKLCVSYNEDNPVDECILSYYYSNYEQLVNVPLDRTTKQDSDNAPLVPEDVLNSLTGEKGEKNPTKASESTPGNSQTGGGQGIIDNGGKATDKTKSTTESSSSGKVNLVGSEDIRPPVSSFEHGLDVETVVDHNLKDTSAAEGNLNGNEEGVSEKSKSTKSTSSTTAKTIHSSQKSSTVKPEEKGIETDIDDDFEVEAGNEDDTPETVNSPSINYKVEKADNLDGESYFFTYFIVICVLFVLGYVGYQHRKKVLALALEGKKGRRHQRARRPNSANYHKLDSNLEEAISSSCSKNSSSVIY